MQTPSVMADVAQLSSLPKELQDEVALIGNHFLNRGERTLKEVCEACAEALGVTWQAVYGRVSRYQKTGDWRHLVNRAKAGPGWWKLVLRTTLPQAFCEHVAQVWARNQRDKFARAHAQLMRQWKAWRSGDISQAIPGYDTCPEPDPDTGIPRGWTSGNLRRCCRPSKYARKLIQIGPKAASQLAPPTLTTRVGLEVGQFYLFDDSWNDFKVLARGQAVRLLSFHALDLASACNVLRGHKPALTDERGIEVRLKEREMVFLLAALLSTHGYRAAGTVLVCEKGTATVREREAALLEQLTRGKVVVRTGPAGGGPGIAGLFTGPGGGNPRWKAALESHFNLQRNAMADMIEFPGQTGSNSRLNKPEGLEAMVANELAVVKLAQRLGPEQLELMRLGLLSYVEAEARIDDMIEIINLRTDHDLEGWRGCGHYVKEWRPSAQLPWQPIQSLLALTNGERESTAALVASNPSLIRERPRCPREVFEAGRRGLVKLGMAEVAMLLGDVDGVERPVRNGIIEVNCPELNQDDVVRFGTARQDGNGTDEPLRDGEKYLVRVNPLAPDYCYLYDSRGGFRGVARNYGRVRKDDAEALQRAWGRKAAWKSAHLDEARRLAAPITRAATEVEASRAAIFGEEEHKERTVLDRIERRAVEAAERVEISSDMMAAGLRPPEEDDFA